MSDKTIGIIVARMTSTRLPGKSLVGIHGRPLLSYHVERLKACKGFDELWLATTRDDADTPLAQWAEAQGILVYRHAGDSNDVVGRLTATVRQAQATQFVFVLGDSPLADPFLLDQYVETLNRHPDWEYVVLLDDELAGKVEAAYCGTGCYRTQGWLKVDAASNTPHYREHLGSVLRENPSLVTMGSMRLPDLYYEGPYRLSIDTQADVDFFNAVFSALKKPDSMVTMADVLTYLREHPEVVAINKHVRQKQVHEKTNTFLFWVDADVPDSCEPRIRELAKMLEEVFSVGIQWVRPSQIPVKKQAVLPVKPISKCIVISAESHIHQDVQRILSEVPEIPLIGIRPEAIPQDAQRLKQMGYDLLTAT